VHPELHAEIRGGLRSDLFYDNFDYLLSLRDKRGLAVMLNVTEHRKNWFELPEVFRFAERHRVYLHINTCIHPHNVTLYTLPTDQCRYVLDYLERQRTALLDDYPRLSNLANYDFLLSLVRSEIASRGPDWRPVITNLNLASDGQLAAPRPGIPPFDRPEAVAFEIDRIRQLVAPETAARLIRDMVGRVRGFAHVDAWRALVRTAERPTTSSGQSAVAPA
jgi:hypothetical protein